MLCYIEPAKDLCSKLHDMEKSKVNKTMTEEMSLIDKLLGTGEERVMFRFVIHLLIHMIYMILSYQLFLVLDGDPHSGNCYGRSYLSILDYS